MHKLEAGDIYVCNFPKFVQIPDTQDHNIDSMKPEAKGRPIVVLQQIDQNRLIAAPISSDGVQNYLKYPSYVPIYQKAYPSFLKGDSFVKTNQPQILDVKWLLPVHEPTKIGQLNPLDLDRVQLRTVYATQTETEYARWISEIVAKNIRIKPAIVETEILNKINLSDRVTIAPKVVIARGDVHLCHFQPEKHNPSENRIYGDHKAIVLTDSKYAHIPTGQTIVVPLIENKVENLAYFSSNDVVYGNERACVSQIQPMNRDWMEPKSASLNDSQTMELDRAVISALGLKDKVINHARSVIQTLLQSKER
jgi:mRNA-degrading endonuclease toxin of MazEF toxin-antitoxin module